MLVKNIIGLYPNFYRHSEEKEWAKRRQGFVEIYGQDKALTDKKVGMCGKYSVINDSIWLEVQH